MRAVDRSLAISTMSDRVEVGEPLPAACSANEDEVYG